MTPGQERVFTWIAVSVVSLFLAAWVGATIELRHQRQEMPAAIAALEAPPPSPTRQITSSFLDSGAPTTAFINDALLGFLNPLRGESGKVQFTTVTPGAPIVGGAPGNVSAVLSSGTSTDVSPDFVAPDRPGVYTLAVQLDQATRAIKDLSVVTLVPISRKRGGRIGLYYLGNWPFEGGGNPKTSAYAAPPGFIEVTRENQGTFVSKHFRLRDFLTKDQANVWPKYLVLNPKLIDKLELTIDEMVKQGIRVDHMHVMSGFRTPRYNHGGGNTAGRANLSRHMYGDACDIFVDNDRNGMMDDINRDRRVDDSDAEVIRQAVERVERDHPALVGGIGVYSACCGHGPFTHIDVRGYRARWRGTGTG